MIFSGILYLMGVSWEKQKENSMKDTEIMMQL
jgi:hypothetical protein